MNGSRRLLTAVLALATQTVLQAQTIPAWQNWSQSEAERVIKSTVETGRIAGGRRILNTERARSYKLRATWMTPEVVRAAARLLQIRSRMASTEIESLLAGILSPGQTIVLIEIDPDEGSGVIPLDWEAFLQPSDDPRRGVAGRDTPALNSSKVLTAGFPRNYDYERFWMVFPLFESDDVELLVRIYGREGRVKWQK